MDQHVQQYISIKIGLTPTKMLDTVMMLIQPVASCAVKDNLVHITSCSTKASLVHISLT